MAKNHSANISSLFGIDIAAPSSGAAYRNYSLATAIVIAPMAADGKRYHSFSDVKGVSDLFGSNSTAAKMATAWFGGGFLGVKPTQFGILTIDANNTLNIAAGSLTYKEATNSFVYGGETSDPVWGFLDSQTTANNPVYVSLSAGEQGEQIVYAKVSNATDKEIQFFTSKATYTTNSAIAFNEAPYSLPDGDATYSAVVYKDSLADALGDILASADYYWLVIDPAFSKEQCLAIQAQIQTKPQGSGYLAVYLDQDDNCWKLDNKDDTETLMVQMYNLQYRYGAVVYANESNINQMQHCAFLSFFGTLSDSQEIGTVDVKTIAGLTANKTSEEYSYDDQPGQDNIGSNPNNPVGKNGNVYSTYTNFGSCFRYGTTATGDEIGRIVLEDWLVNRMLVNLWNWRKNAKSAKYTSATQDNLIRCITAPLAQRAATGDIVTGLSADEQYNLPLGYQVSVPMASSTDRQQRVWTGMSFAYLYGNSAKYFEVHGIGTI